MKELAKLLLEALIEARNDLSRLNHNTDYFDQVIAIAEKGIEI